MLLKLKYTQNELKNLDTLYRKYYAFSIHATKKQEVIDTWEAIKAITDRVEREALEYYKTHLDELDIDVQDEFKLFMAEISNNDPDYIFPDYWLNWALDTLSPYLKLLDNSAKEKIQEIYENLKSIIGGVEMEKLIDAAMIERRYTSTGEFLFMRQNKAVKKFAEVSTKGLEVRKDTGDLEIIDGDFIVSISNYNELAGLKASTKKLLDELIMCFTNGQAGFDYVELPLSEHMKLCGLKDIKETREQVKNDLKTLENIRLTFDQKINSEIEHYASIHVIGSNGIKNSVIRAVIDSIFIKSLLVYKAMPLPKPILGLNDKRNPNSYYLGRRVAFHKGLNYGKK